MKKRIILFSLFMLSFLLIFSTVISATDNINDSTISQYSSTDLNDVDGMNDENVNGNEKISKTINLNSENFENYVTNGKFNENVSDGDTIDIQGKLDHERFTFEVDKPVNIISSTGVGYIDFDTQNSGKIFKISKEGSGTNITGITVHNTRFSVENTSNIYISNVSCIDEEATSGMGVGATTIREGSENITITNSYFKTRGNGGHSNVVFAAAYNCLFENNTVEGDGSNRLIGNLLYLTTYNVQKANPKTNINITIRNNIIRSWNTGVTSTCYDIALEGKGHIIENNIIDNPFPVMAQYADAEYGMETNIENIIFRNNTLSNGITELVFPGIVTNNTLNGPTTLKQVHTYNNTFNNNVTIQNNVKFENNTANKIKNNVLIAGSLYGDDTIITEDNEVIDNTPSYNTNTTFNLIKTE